MDQIEAKFKTLQEKELKKATGIGKDSDRQSSEEKQLLSEKAKNATESGQGLLLQQDHAAKQKIASDLLTNTILNDINEQKNPTSDGKDPPKYKTDPKPSDNQAQKSKKKAIRSPLDVSDNDDSRSLTQEEDATIERVKNRTALLADQQIDEANSSESSRQKNSNSEEFDSSKKRVLSKPTTTLEGTKTLFQTSTPRSLQESDNPSSSHQQMSFEELCEMQAKKSQDEDPLESQLLSKNLIEQVAKASTDLNFVGFENRVQRLIRNMLEKPVIEMQKQSGEIDKLWDVSRRNVRRLHEQEFVLTKFQHDSSIVDSFENQFEELRVAVKKKEDLTDAKIRELSHQIKHQFSDELNTLRHELGNWGAHSVQIERNLETLTKVQKDGFLSQQKVQAKNQIDLEVQIQELKNKFGAQNSEISTLKQIIEDVGSSQAITKAENMSFITNQKRLFEDVNSKMDNLNQRIQKAEEDRMAKYYQQVAELDVHLRQLQKQSKQSIELTKHLSRHLAVDRQVYILNLISEVMSKSLQGEVFNNFIETVSAKQEQLSKKKMTLTSDSNQLFSLAKNQLMNPQPFFALPPKLTEKELQEMQSVKMQEEKSHLEELIANLQKTTFSHPSGSRRRGSTRNDELSVSRQSSSSHRRQKNSRANRNQEKDSMDKLAVNKKHEKSQDSQQSGFSQRFRSKSKSRDRSIKKSRTRRKTNRPRPQADKDRTEDEKMDEMFNDKQRQRQRGQSMGQRRRTTKRRISPPAKRQKTTNTQKLHKDDQDIKIQPKQENKDGSNNQQISVILDEVETGSQAQMVMKTDQRQIKTQESSQKYNDDYAKEQMNEAIQKPNVTFDDTQAKKKRQLTSGNLVQIKQLKTQDSDYFTKELVPVQISKKQESQKIVQDVKRSGDNENQRSSQTLLSDTGDRDPRIDPDQDLINKTSNSHRSRASSRQPPLQQQDSFVNQCSLKDSNEKTTSDVENELNSQEESYYDSQDYDSDYDDEEETQSENENDQNRQPVQSFDREAEEPWIRQLIAEMREGYMKEDAEMYAQKLTTINQQKVIERMNDQIIEVEGRVRNQDECVEKFELQTQARFQIQEQVMHNIESENQAAFSQTLNRFSALDTRLDKEVEYFHTKLDNQFDDFLLKIEGELIRRNRLRITIENRMNGQDERLEALESMVQQFGANQQKSLGTIKKLAYGLSIQSALNIQDERDRDWVSLFGNIDEKTGQYFVQQNGPIHEKRLKIQKKISKEPQSYVSMNGDCISCTGQSAQKLNLFKIACLNYQSNPVTYQDSQFERKDLISLFKVISDMAKELIDATSFEQQDHAQPIQHIQISMQGENQNEVINDQKKDGFTDRTFMNLTEKKSKEDSIDLLPLTKNKGGSSSNQMLTQIGKVFASKVLDKLDFKDEDLRMFRLKQTDPIAEQKRDIFGDETNEAKKKTIASYKKQQFQSQRAMSAYPGANRLDSVLQNTTTQHQNSDYAQKRVRKLSSRGLLTSNKPVGGSGTAAAPMLGYMRQKDSLSSVPGSNYGPNTNNNTVLYQNTPKNNLPSHSSQLGGLVADDLSENVKHIVASSRAVIADIPIRGREEGRGILDQSSLPDNQGDLMQTNQTTTRSKFRWSKVESKRDLPLGDPEIEFKNDYQTKKDAMKVKRNMTTDQLNLNVKGAKIVEKHNSQLQSLNNSILAADSSTTKRHQLVVGNSFSAQKSHKKFRLQSMMSTPMPLNKAKEYVQQGERQQFVLDSESSPEMAANTHHPKMSSTFKKSSNQQQIHHLIPPTDRIPPHTAKEVVIERSKQDSQMSRRAGRVVVTNNLNQRDDVTDNSDLYAVTNSSPMIEEEVRGKGQDIMPNSSNEMVFKLSPIKTNGNSQVQQPQPLPLPLREMSGLRKAGQNILLDTSNIQSQQKKGQKNQTNIRAQSSLA